MAFHSATRQKFTLQVITVRFFFTPYPTLLLPDFAMPSDLNVTNFLLTVWKEQRAQLK